MSHIYAINGFFMAMREKYTKESASIHYFTIEWCPTKSSWADFRGKILGATDPATADEGAVRRTILDQYKELGLDSMPDVGDNGVHASASPFEALAERINWTGAKLEEDAFGAAMIAAGIPVATIEAWTKDPQVEFEGEKRSLFDLLEDLDCEDCLKKSQKIAGVEGDIPACLNMAYVFIKPHAVTPKVVELVKSKFEEVSITITKEGSIDGATIEKDMLVDNHYYAIACKASLCKPDELNPPAKAQAAFEEKWGLSWAQALEDGQVYNAVDACKKMGIDGETMDTTWGACKKAGELIKFGGGFYCGKLAL
eukprot:CAMPEP_0198209510 /NCGR_PEP_ID=MMETSP1445-20131203/16568_1 /TAXON_ID=36898 /ORGANISM="Pyramimonas sp., Strain CCMP2087" /LENGTH=310 /DNA_ID=CAMNT_0043883311 /DNA_START=60 /DNA_END=992 /DNA_ORIENTATION=-